MMEKIKALYTQYRDVFWYLVIGVITTLIDLATFTIAHTVLGVHYQIAKVLAWVLAVAFAFVGNKWMVFRTETKDAKGILAEAIRFVGARVLTLVFALAFMFVAVEWLALDENLANLLCTAAVFVLNYVLSKLLVFRKKKAEEA